MGLPDDPRETAAAYAPDAMPEQQKPRIVPDAQDVTSPYVRHYTRWFRKLDRAMQRLFGDLQVADEQLSALPVPIIVGTVEAAIAAMFGETSTFGSNYSGQYRSVVLPMAVLVPGDPAPDMSRNIWREARTWGAAFTERRAQDTRLGFSVGVPINRPYTLVLWTRYVEDMGQLMEQAVLKLHEEAEFWLPEDFFPTTVRLDGAIGTNFNEQKESGQIRLYKAQAPMTAYGWLPQPPVRRRTVLDIKLQTVLGVEPPAVDCGIQHITREDAEKRGVRNVPIL